MLNSGDKIGLVTVIKEIDPHIGPSGVKHRRYLCRCQCGNEKSFIEYNLKKAGDHANCGCLNKKEVAERSRTHGKSHTRLYGIWGSMLKRCRNPNDYHYASYGARGIVVCREWEQYEAFEQWAMANGYKEGLSIDRIDVYGNYCPENCRWTTNFVQQNNRRVTFYITYKDEKLPLSEWSLRTGISRETLRYRILQGWDTEKALFTPVDEKKSPKVRLGGKCKDVI